MLLQVNIAFNLAVTEGFRRKSRVVRQLDETTPEQIEKDCGYPRRLVKAFGKARAILSSKYFSVYELYWYQCRFGKGLDPVSFINEAFVEERKKHRR